MVSDGLPNAKPIATAVQNQSASPKPSARSAASDPLTFEGHPIDRGGSIRFAVKDQGVGMSPEQLLELFAEGVQFDANKLQAGGGSGLGLSISKGIVEQHGGTIKVESEGYGMGTTFTVELPLYKFPQGVPSSAEHGRGMNEARTDASSTTDSHPRQPKKHHVLVVEDSASNRKMLVRLIERAGHTVATATNGQEAVDAYMRDVQAGLDDPDHVPFDTILMDSEMPVMNGPDTTRKLRKMGCTTAILGVTGNVLSEDVDHFKAQGADEVFGKVRKAIWKEVVSLLVSLERISDLVL